MPKATLRPTITKRGQQYVDDPVFVMPKRELASPIAQSVGAAFNDGESRLLMPVQVGTERVRLQWMKPDGKGGLVPK